MVRKGLYGVSRILRALRGSWFKGFLEVLMVFKGSHRFFRVRQGS